MSCVTCEVTPPDGRGGPDRIHSGHIGHAFGDMLTIGTAVLYHGHDVTLQTVEALAGNEDSGWVEMRIMNTDGQPTIHPPAEWTCPNCGGPRTPPETVDGWPGPGDTDVTRWAACDCGNNDRPTIAYGPHPYTVIRYGHVQIILGTEVINGPTSRLPANSNEQGDAT